MRNDAGLPTCDGPFCSRSWRLDDTTGEWMITSRQGFGGVLYFCSDACGIRRLLRFIDAASSDQRERTEATRAADRG